MFTLPAMGPLYTVGAKIILWEMMQVTLKPEGLFLEARKLPPYKLHPVSLLITFIYVIEMHQDGL